jgi:hypothetical protein
MVFPDMPFWPPHDRQVSLLQKEWKDLEKENEKNEITGGKGPPEDYDFISRKRALSLISLRFGIETKYRGRAALTFNFSLRHKTNTDICGGERK